MKPYAPKPESIVRKANRYASLRAKTYGEAMVMERAYLDGWNAHCQWLKKRQPSKPTCNAGDQQ